MKFKYTGKTSRMGRKMLLDGAMLVAGAAMFGAPISQVQAAWPEKPITVVVAYKAGGGVDKSSRVIAQEMAKHLGVKIKVINKTGAIGAKAEQFVLKKPADGSWVLATGNYNKAVRTKGHPGTVAWDQWQYFQSADVLASWSVKPGSKFKSFEDVVAYAKKNPGKLTLSTSGSGGVWHEIALNISAAAGIKLKYIHYKGGKPATLAGLQGEVDIAGGGLHEHVPHLRGGKLRNLVISGPKDINVKGAGTLRSVGGPLPSLQSKLPLSGIFTMALHRDTPLPILKKFKEAYVKAVASAAWDKRASKLLFQTKVLTGKDADRRAALVETLVSAALYSVKEELGKKVKSPKELGLPTPADFDEWWPPKGYKPTGL